MKLAMTSIAVTASICASASEAALLVASFMSNSLDLGVTHRCAKHARTMAIDLLLGTPRDEHSPLTESPLGERRPCQSRTAIRRQFGSRAAGLCTGDGVFWSVLNCYSLRARFKLSSCAGIAAGSVTG